MKATRLIRDRQGATTVEFAVIVSLLVTLLFGVMEFGVYLFNQQIITNACREAARAGIVARIPRLNDNEISQVARNYCQANLVTFGSPASPSVTVGPSGRALTFGSPLQVAVSYNYEFLVLDNLLGIGPQQINASTLMQME